MELMSPGSVGGTDTIIARTARQFYRTGQITHERASQGEDKFEYTYEAEAVSIPAMWLIHCWYVNFTVVK